MLGNRRASVVFALITVFIDVLGMGLVFPILPRLVQHLMGGAIGEASFAYGLLLFMPSCSSSAHRSSERCRTDSVGGRCCCWRWRGWASTTSCSASLPTCGGSSLGGSSPASAGATITPAGAYIADVSPPEKRAANFGLIGIAFGLGFIAGPALGGLLGEANLRLPFMVCAALTFVNFLFGLLVMSESLRPENRRAIDWRQTNPCRRAAGRVAPQERGRDHPGVRHLATRSTGPAERMGAVHDASLRLECH
jgi:MFS transporter, DHA1 family, tetracycline resistance protein